MNGYEGPLDAVLSRVDIRDVSAWLGCSAEAGDRVWMDDGLIWAIVEEARHSLVKAARWKLDRCFRGAAPLGGRAREALRQLLADDDLLHDEAVEMFLAVRRRLKPREDTASTKHHFESWERFRNWIRSTISSEHMARDRINRFCSHYEVPVPIEELQEGPGAIDVWGDQELPGMLEDLCKGVSRFFADLERDIEGNRRATGLRTIYGLIRSLYADDAIACYRVLVGFDTPELVLQKYKEMMKSSFNHNTYSSLMLRLREKAQRWAIGHELPLPPRGGGRRS